MIQIEILALVLTGIGIIVSILYYTSVLRNADRTRRTQLYMDIKKQLDDPGFWHIYFNIIYRYEWRDHEEFYEKYSLGSDNTLLDEIWSVLSLFNSIGVLVALERIDYDLLGMHMGEMPGRLWDKMESVIMEWRKQYNPYTLAYLEFLKDEELKRMPGPRGKASYLRRDT